MKNTDNNNEYLSPRGEKEKVENSSKKLSNFYINKCKSKEQSPTKRMKKNFSQEEESEKNIIDISKNSEAKKLQIKNNIFNILAKDFQNRSGQEIRYAADYLSKNYTYFINLKNNDSQFKVEKLTKICKLEKFKPGEIIILYGDIGDKFYIVLEGSIVIYKPEYVEELMRPIDFLKLLNKLKEEDELKYERVKNKNDNFYFDTTEIDKIDQNTAFMRNKFNFLIEVDDRKGEYGEGFSFGEIALIQKTPRNATIKSVENSVCLSIAKDDYNLAMKEIESKKLSKELEKFQKNYQFFNCFDKEKTIKLFNCFSKIVLYKGDFLFHQNDLNDCLYIIIKGSFEVFSHISFSWLNEYFNYIDDSLGNILFYMIKNQKMKYSELREIIENIKLDSTNSPMSNIFYNNLNDICMNNENNLKDNLLLIKNDEEKINSKHNIFKINLKKIDYYDILGLEDSFEFKKKFYSVKCISSSAEVKCIKINELLRIIWHSSNEDLLYLLKIVINRKNILKKELINGVKNLEKKILFGLDIRYENLIKYEDNIYTLKNNNDNKDNNDIDNACLKNKLKAKYYNMNKYTKITKEHKKQKENEINRIVSAIKVKGYKMSIQDILDENIKILPKAKTKLEKKIYRNKSAINLNILKAFLKKKTSDRREFKFKNNFSNFAILESNNELPAQNISRYFSPISSKRYTHYTSFKNNANNIREFSGFSSDRNSNPFQEIKLQKKEIGFLSSRSRNRNRTPINNIRTSKIANKFNDEAKKYFLGNINNYGNNPIKKTMILDFNSINNNIFKKIKHFDILSPKNNVRMKKNISITNSNINAIRNKINSAKININKMNNNLFGNNNKGMLDNFIKNKCNSIKINITNEESLIKVKKTNRILNKDNEKNMPEKKNFYNVDNILNIKKKPQILNDEYKIKFDNRYISKINV